MVQAKGRFYKDIAQFNKSLTVSGVNRIMLAQG